MLTVPKSSRGEWARGLQSACHKLSSLCLELERRVCRHFLSSQVLVVFCGWRGCWPAWSQCFHVWSGWSLSHTTYYKDHRPRHRVIWLDSNLPHFVRTKTISDRLALDHTNSHLIAYQQILNRPNSEDEWYFDFMAQGPGVFGGKKFQVFPRTWEGRVGVGRFPVHALSSHLKRGSPH